MIGRLVVLAVGLVVLYFGLMLGASELAEEVVVLHTTDAEGRRHRTSLWIVEDKLGNSWLRAGMADSGWLERIRGNDEVELERAGSRLPYRAVPVSDPEQRRRIHALMRERYGVSDRIISALRDGSGSVPVRLDPLGH